MIESIFLKETTKHLEEFVAAVDTDSQSYSEHYVTEYYYELSPNQFGFLRGILDWGLIAILVGIPIVMFNVVYKNTM